MPSTSGRQCPLLVPAVHARTVQHEIRIIVNHGVEQARIRQPEPGGGGLAWHPGQQRMCHGPLADRDDQLLVPPLPHVIADQPVTHGDSVFR